MIGLAVVVPSADAEESRVCPQKRRSGVEVLEEIGSNLEIILWMRSGLEGYFEDDDLIVMIGVEHFIQEPAKVTR